MVTIAASALRERSHLPLSVGHLHAVAAPGNGLYLTPPTAHRSGPQPYVPPQPVLGVFKNRTPTEAEFGVPP